MSASEIPPATAPSEPPPPDAIMLEKAFTIPIVVPSRPTNGAVAPIVARMPRPRFSSATMISIWRSTARSAELMSAAVIVARSRSNGLTSARASPSTRATWLFLVFSASAIAASRCSSWRKRENSGTKRTVSRVDFRSCHHFMMKVETDQIDMKTRMTTIPLAKAAEFVHRSMIFGIRCDSSPLVLDRVLNRDMDQHAYGLAVHAGGPEQRVHHRLFGGFIEPGVGGLDHLQRVGLDVTQRVDDRLDHDHALDLRLLQQRRIHGLRAREPLRLLLHHVHRQHRVARRHDTGGDAAFDADAREVLGIEMLLQVHRRDVGRDVGRRDHRLEALELHVELRRWRLIGLLLFRLHVHQSGVDLGAGVRLRRGQRREDGATDDAGVHSQRHDAGPESLSCLARFLRLDEHVKHGFSSRVGYRNTTISGLPASGGFITKR